LLSVVGVLAPAGLAQIKTNTYIQRNLVSDIPGFADVTDPNLVNPWGLSTSATSPFWASDAGKGVSTLYNGSGAITAVVAAIPGPGGSAKSTPTGQVNNSNTTSFLLANGRAASFIFVTEEGTLSGWNTGANATLFVDNSSKGAVYTGLAIGVAAAGPQLYAANFRSGAIDVFDAKWAPTQSTGSFVDPTLPAGYAPYNIWNLGGTLYVTYAKQNAAKNDIVPGAGNGFVSAFNLEGVFQRRIVSGGALNAPWGIAIAPANFGAFGGALLVGNFADGKINAYDLPTGGALGTLQDINGKTIVIDGLWALLVGNGRNGGDQNTLYFTAGIQGEQHGLLGSLAPPAAVISVVNAASYAVGSIAPGEIVLINGQTVGPSPQANGRVPSSGAVDFTVGNTTVTFNGVPAGILYASASATAAIVPYDVAGSPTATVGVSVKGVPVSAQLVRVAGTAPGLFTLDTTGKGQATAINADGKVNGTAAPADAGSKITLYATGEGAVAPPIKAGNITDAKRAPQATILATIGGVPATVNSAGSAVGSVAGLMVVEVVVPPGLASGPQPVVITADGVPSQAGVTIVVK
jgi:uncharacterized protein (TIGR03118 family)